MQRTFCVLHRKHETVFSPAAAAPEASDLVGGLATSCMPSIVVYANASKLVIEMWLSRNYEL